MDKENFFTKLRRVASTTESGTARLKGCMGRPIAGRSSSRDGPPSARLTLKEMHIDAQKTKENIQEKVTELQASSSSFEEMLDACEGLFDIQSQQVEDLEDYLEQYGYKKYPQDGMKKPHRDKTEEAKENVSPGDGSSSTVDEDHMKPGKVPSTPPMDPTAAPPVDPNKTPQLADFGISQLTIDRFDLAGRSRPISDLKASGFNAHQHPGVMSAMKGHLHPSTPRGLQGAPFNNHTIMVTPGLFDNRVVSTETPKSFTDKRSYLFDSPVPPVLLSAVKKGQPMTYDPRVTGRQSRASPEPEAPTVTAWMEYVPLPAPPPQLHIQSSIADVTPPMPVCTAFQAATIPAPSEPARLTDRFPIAASAPPSEPVQLSRQLVEDQMPAEPVRLADTLTSRYGHPACPDAPGHFSNDRRTAFTSQIPNGRGGVSIPHSTGQLANGRTPGQRSQPLTPRDHPRTSALAAEPEMPLTPELTMTYQSYQVGQ